MAFKKPIIQFWPFGLIFLFNVVVSQSSRDPSCYDSSGRAKQCWPQFENAAWEKPLEVTNTCGLKGPQEFCRHSYGYHQQTRPTCDTCDATNAQRQHPASYMTDSNFPPTWWQSETLLEGAQYPNTVNITLKLGKSFDVTYIRLKFHSPQPESFAIYKKTFENSSWVPYQFYSGSCLSTYGKQSRNTYRSSWRTSDTEAYCIDEYSDIYPLSGGAVPFSTLENRPSAMNFENSPVLQEWVTATEIKIVLTRMNTFGDESFGGPQVKRSYFYAISDFSIGARCNCNGHANECIRSPNGKLMCKCEHHTKGQDCEMCEDFYNSKPWKRATSTDAHECKACNCNDHSNKCYFDEDLFKRTGDGGHCTECQHSTTGVHCERCQDFHFGWTASDGCQPCGCNPTGSQSQQCDDSGKCVCKQGFSGDKCY